MKSNIKQVQEAMLDGSLISNPHLCAEYRSMLSGEYSYLVGELEEIKSIKPLVWLEMRKEYKSDSATDKAYDATESGIREEKLRSQIKRIEKLISGLGSLIRIAESESHNQY